MSLVFVDRKYPLCERMISYRKVYTPSNRGWVRILRIHRYELRLYSL